MSAMPERSGSVLPASWRGPLPFLYFLPSVIPTIRLSAARVSGVTGQEAACARTLAPVATGHVSPGDGAPAASGVDPQNPSWPLVAQPAIRPGARLSLVTTRV